MRRIITTGVALAALLLPATALATGSSSCQAYNSPTLCSVVSNGNATKTTSTSAPTSASSLPFTGLDLGLLIGGGAALIGAGFVVRVLSRRLN